MKPIVPIIYFLGLDEILITNFLNLITIFQF